MKRLLPVLVGFTLLLLLGGCQTTSTQYNDRGWFDPMKRSLNNKSYGYQIVKDVTGSAPTKLIERFEVRPGDCSANIGGWDDCATDRERSEISQENKDIFIGNTEWYGWHLFVPKEHKDIWPTAVYMGQFHQVHAKPAWMFYNRFDGYYLDYHVGKDFQFAKLLDIKDFLGQWNKIEVNAKWSDGNDGYFRVYVNGKLNVNFGGKTASASKLYFKYGIYRSFVSRYKIVSHGKVPPTQIIYFTKVKRGSSRDSIQ